MRRLSELAVLTKGGEEVASSVAHRLHHSHVGNCAPQKWIRKAGERSGQGVMVMLWLMCCPKGLEG